MRIEPVPAGGSRVEVQMTLTAPGCGMGHAISMDAQRRIERLPGVDEADVQLVWDPPWNPQMISPEGRGRSSAWIEAAAGPSRSITVP